jgi:hypothetical protein
MSSIAARTFDRTLAEFGFVEFAEEAEYVGRRAALLIATELPCKQQPDLVLNEAQAAELMRVSRETVHDRQQCSRLIAFRGPDGSLVFRRFSSIDSSCPNWWSFSTYCSQRSRRSRLSLPGSRPPTRNSMASRRLAGSAPAGTQARCVTGPYVTRPRSSRSYRFPRHRAREPRGLTIPLGHSSLRPRAQASNPRRC